MQSCPRIENESNRIRLRKIAISHVIPDEQPVLLTTAYRRGPEVRFGEVTWTCSRRPVHVTRTSKAMGRAFPVKLIGDEDNRCAAYRLLFTRRFPKRALSSRRRAVRERVTNRLAPIATLALPSHKGSFLQRREISKMDHRRHSPRNRKVRKASAG